MKQPLLSIIIAAHREGRLAHKTMLSVERATQALQDNNIPYEIIVTIDNGDQQTSQYFEWYSQRNNVSLHFVSFGDLALSRNYGIAEASGTFIATLDADDLVSENWFFKGVSMLTETKKPLVLHTHYSINFGTQDVIWEKFDSRSKAEDAIIMTWANRWDSAVIAPRSVFEQFPYQPNVEGYGSEDWHFNSETLAADIPHKIVPETILFVRRKDISLMTQQAADRRTVRYTDLLNFDYLRSIDTSSFSDQSTTIQETGRQQAARLKQAVKRSLVAAHRTAKRSKTYELYSKKALSKLRKQISPQKPHRFPDWLMDEWHAIHKLEKQLFPDEHLVENIPLYHSEMYELGTLLTALARPLTATPDYVLFVPYLAPGGAELVALRYVKTLHEIHPDWHIVVVTTEPGDTSWKERLPKKVDFIDFGNLTGHLSETLRLQLMARFIVQGRTPRLHISQSPLMFRFAELYQKLIAPLTVYAFAFCEDTDNQGRIAGHVHSGLPFAYDAIDKVFTDNSSIIPSLKEEYGYYDEKFHTHYQPVDYTLTLPKESLNTKHVRVLWASRVAKQKRPDILLSIAKLLPEQFHIDVYGSFQDGYSALDLSVLPNAVTYKGTFNGLSSIPTADYDIFLYTSENDGIPNILLEAASLGLPIVASSVGGIAEFITSTTGKPIADYENADVYIDALTEIAGNNSLRLKLATNAQQLLKTQHSKQQFAEHLSKDIS